MIVAGALLFDMDGLMVDSEPLWFEVEREFARARGGEWTEPLAHACIGKGLANTIRVMGEVLGLAVDVDRDVEALADLFLARASTLALQPGALELLDAARGVVPIAVASSSKRRLVRGILEGLGVASHFDAMLSGDDVTRAKPAPDLFLAAAKALGARAEECVVLEDSLAGATAGHAAGMKVIAVPEEPTPGLDAVATVIVKDLHEARALLTLARPERR